MIRAVEAGKYNTHSVFDFHGTPGIYFFKRGKLSFCQNIQTVSKNTIRIHLQITSEIKIQII